MRRKIVAGNWKMHGATATIKQLTSSLVEHEAKTLGAELIVFPPYPYLAQVQASLNATKIAWGAQNVCQHVGEGAFTGEISGGMLREFGCQYVLIGHSERRLIYQEADNLLRGKLVSAYRSGLTPIFCIGETEDQRQQGLTEKTLEQQLSIVCSKIDTINLLDKIIIAYEPVWAIGTGRTASPEQAQHIHHFIRQLISGYNNALAEQTSILYGGSVKSANAKELFAMPDIDGGLVGGASLIADEFIKISQQF